MFCLGTETAVAFCVSTEQQMGHPSMIILGGEGVNSRWRTWRLYCGLEAKIITPSSVAPFIILEISAQTLFAWLFENPTCRMELVFKKKQVFCISSGSERTSEV